MKRILALLFCGVLLFSMAACGENTENPTTGTDSQSSVTATGSSTDEVSASTQTDGQTDASAEASTDSSSEDSTDISDNPSTDADEEDPKEEIMKYGLIMDDSGNKILVVNPELGGSSPSDFDWSKAIVWEWSVNDAKGCKIYGQDVRIDCTKYRYSSYYKKDVIIFCGSKGWAGIIDYETKEVLFETKVNVAGPHSVELMPNGDLVMACSGNSNYDAGAILYYPLSSGATSYSSSVSLWGAHSVVYDPDNKMILALGGKEIIGLTVTDGGTKTAKLVTVPEKHVEMFYPGTTAPNGSGHELIPVLGQPGKYFLAADGLFLYDSVNNTISYDDALATKYTLAQTKGMAYFADGISVQTAHNQGGTGNYRSSLLRVLYPEGDTLKEVMIPHRSGSATYKVGVFTKDYR